MVGFHTLAFLAVISCSPLAANTHEAPETGPVLVRSAKASMAAKLAAFYMNFCTPSNQIAKDFYILNAMAGPWPSDLWCRAISSAPANPGSYDLSIDMNNFIGNGKANYGHPGVLFNVKDSLNFDFVYVRPHSATGCFQTGHVVEGVRTFSVSSHCPKGPPRGRQWFNIKVLIRGPRTAYLMLNNYLVTIFRTHFPPLRGGGAMTAHGYKNLVFFKNYKIRPVASDWHVLTTAGCALGSGRFVNSSYVVNAANSQPTFCRMLLPESLRTSANSYQLSLRLFNVRTKSGNVGHPGVMYNVQDMNNYDFVYFRPHSSSGCYQTGYVRHGTATFRAQGSCQGGPPPSQAAFSVKVHVTDARTVHLFMNNKAVVTVTPQFPVTPRVGINVANGYGNIVKADTIRLTKL